MNRILIFVAIVLLFSACKNSDNNHLYIAVTTDVHGKIFGLDPASGDTNETSMSKISGFLKEYKGNLLLLDNGDNLQGSPSVYFYNFENTSGDHIWPKVMNYMGYDAITVGNHDFEAGHGVYDRISDEFKAPLLAANAVNIETGKPYFEPYTIVNRGGLNIAIMGLVTPGVPGWIPEVLYRGIEFEDMLEAAKKWMPEILSKEPDMVIGLFHSGWNDSYGGGEPGSYMNENASLTVAREVDGFDIIFIGHDHDLMSDYIETNSGDSVLIMDGGSHARYFSFVEVNTAAGKEADGISFEGKIIKADTLSTDREFDKEFSKDYTKVSSYINRKIVWLKNDLSGRDAYFGDSDFMDLIHHIQLEYSGADISFAAPLSFDVTIPKGDLRVSDMFDLYRFENMLYTIELSGEEIDSYLEYSTSLWFNTLEKDSKVLLKYSDEKKMQLANRYYNFDSAAGIDYTINLTKPDGEKVTINSLSGDRVFSPDSIYKVALNSYRGTGGGGHLTRGCKLSNKEIEARMVSSTEKDLRFYMMQWLELQDTISIIKDNNWSLEPSALVEELASKESLKLFK